MSPGSGDARRPRSRVFDVMIGASAMALIGVAALVGTGHFAVSTPYGGTPVPLSATAVNRCQALVLAKLPADADVHFPDDGTTHRFDADRSWVIRGRLEVGPVDGDPREGEYVCDHLRDLPPGSDNWRADQVLVLGV